MKRLTIPATMRTMADDEVEVVMSTSALARDGHILVPSGCDLRNYLTNPIVLFQHDPMLPIGNAENIQVGRDQISARIRFAPLGISECADETRGLMKAGVLRAVSVGFNPIEGEPLDPTRPRGGQRFVRWELLELSAVSVPADPGATVTARAAREGKTFSAANAATLREAHDLAEQCRDRLAGMIGEPDVDDYAERQRDLALLGDRPAGITADHERRQRELDALTLSPGAMTAADVDWKQRQREAAAMRVPRRR